MAKRKLTEVQEARIAELTAESGRRIYEYGYQGAGVLRSVERYLTTGDSSKITRSARDFLMMQCGFIAHFDYHGFVGTYRNVRLFLDEFKAWRPYSSLRREPSSVYADGMTDIEVMDRLFLIVDTYAPEAAQRAAVR